MWLLCGHRRTVRAIARRKGGKPRERGLRILPWAVYKHTKAILPDIILMENVEEIQQWGPLDADGHPIKERRGERRGLSEVHNSHEVSRICI